MNKLIIKAWFLLIRLWPFSVENFSFLANYVLVPVNYSCSLRGVIDLWHDYLTIWEQYLECSLSQPTVTRLSVLSKKLKIIEEIGFSVKLLHPLSKLLALPAQPYKRLPKEADWKYHTGFSQHSVNYWKIIPQWLHCVPLSWEMLIVKLKAWTTHSIL